MRKKPYKNKDEETFLEHFFNQEPKAMEEELSVVDLEDCLEILDDLDSEENYGRL